MAPRIFVSHPKEDSDLAGALVDLIQHGCGLAAEQVFCSSKTGARIPAGRDFKLYMRDQLRDTDLLVQLVTPAYLDSVFCMFELGAAWVKGIDTFPLIVRPVTYDKLDPITGGIEARSIDDRAALDELYEAVASRCDTPPNLTVWGQHRTRFRRSLKSRLRSVSQPRKVTIAEFSALQAALTTAQGDARYARALPNIATVFEHVRDGYYFLEGAESDTGTVHEEIFLTLMGNAIKEIARAFEAISGTPCRAVIKWLEEPPTSPIELDAWPVRDLVRSHDNRVRSAPADFVGNNSDFRSIIEGREEVFVGNDLPAMFLKGDYANSHWTEDNVRSDKVAYRSAIVAPIGRFLEDRTLAAALGFDAVGQDLVGFLCIDAKERHAFQDPRDIVLARTLAHGLFPVLHLYSPFTYDSPEVSTS